MDETGNRSIASTPYFVQQLVAHCGEQIKQKSKDKNFITLNKHRITFG
jgi:hypothetical protein